MLSACEQTGGVLHRESTREGYRSVSFFSTGQLCMNSGTAPGHTGRRLLGLLPLACNAATCKGARKDNLLVQVHDKGSPWDCILQTHGTQMYIGA